MSTQGTSSWVRLKHGFCYNVAVSAKAKKKKAARPVFDSIRKPTAPPSLKLGTDKPEEKALPSLRKAKHKVKIEVED